MSKEKHGKLSLISAYVISFAFFCVIMLLSPPVNDDYAFLSYGLTNIKDMFRFALYYGNGRLLGNLTSLILIPSQPLFAIQKAAILFITVFLFSKLFKKDGENENSLFLFLSAFVLIIGISPNIFAVIIPWSTCFQNYVPPVTGLLICLHLIKKDGSVKYEAAAAVITFITALTSQLYLEINTVVNIAFSCLITLIFIKTKREKSKIIKSVSFAVGSVAGGAVMFLIPRTFIDPERMEIMNEYRQYNIGQLKEIVDTAYLHFLDIVLEISYFSALLLFISFCVILIMRQSGKSRFYRIFCSAGSVAFSAYSLSMSSIMDNHLFVKQGTYLILYFVLLGIFVLSLFMCILSMEKGYEKNFSVISFLFVFVSIAPLAAVSPISKRCYLLYYLFMAACGMGLASYLVNRKLLSIDFKRVLAICACVLCFHIGVNYISIKAMSDIQIKCIEAQLDDGKDVVEVPEIPNRYFHNTSCSLYGYHFYRNEPFDSYFQLVPFENYEEMLNK